MTKVITRGQEYSLVLQSDYAEEIAVIDGGQWIKFNKEGNRFSLNHIPQADELQIAVKINWYDEKFKTILEYRIDGKSI